MACRQIWEDIYAIEVFKSGTSLAQIVAGPPVLGSGVHGVAGSYTAGQRFNLLVDGAYPSLKASFAQVEKELATGKSIQNVVSLTPVASRPDNVTIPLVFNAHNLSTMMRLFFQDGVALATGSANTALQIMTCKPYESACPVVYANLIRFRQDSDGTDTVDQVLKGLIPTRIMIRGEEGGVIEGEVEFGGAAWDHLDLSAHLANAMPFDSLPPLKFEDLTVKMGTSTVSIPSFEITISNQLTHHFYNDTFSKSVTLGRLTVEAQITIPWNEPSVEGTDKQIEDFVAGQAKIVSLIWGNPNTVTAIGSSFATLFGGADTISANAKNQVVNNYFAFHSLMRIMDYDENDIDENPMVTTNFKVLDDEVGTLDALTIYIGYNSTNNNWTE